jgi:hypothetical protein
VEIVSSRLGEASPASNPGTSPPKFFVFGELEEKPLLLIGEFSLKTSQINHEHAADGT